MKFNSFSAHQLRNIKGNIYLFDEPALFLHPRAQQKILEDFIKLSEHNNLVIYTTHSHYFLKKELIENTIVVSNDPKTAGIKAIPYKQSLNKFPNQQSYLLPLTHILDFVPSSFEMDRPSLLVEGKTDFFFFSLILSKTIQDKISIIPGTGVVAFSPILSILLGWRQKVIVLMDADKAGKREKRNYIKKHFETEKDRVKILSDFAEAFNDHSAEDVILSFYGNEIEEFSQRFTSFSINQNEKKPETKESIKSCVQRYIAERHAAIAYDTHPEFIIKEGLKPFIENIEKWINEQLIGK
ncbi:hypothetical protein COMNV_00026 [Commensalibacter sp. Nvir]|uniref:ATP-dependent nuclease n=1 Tax=Commensalibacter sp. Nvir TaxID=3069817 RepID=UPI002D630D44|nr:hypothetical protein COMNV_00026 [Commensalibacter sp. Nvir]